MSQRQSLIKHPKQLISPEKSYPQNVRLVLDQLDSWTSEGKKFQEESAGKGPIRELHIELTHRCNLKCLMCHHWQMPGRDPGSVRREMDLEQIRKLCESPEFDQVQWVVLSGGEPMLRADFDDIAACLAHRFPDADLIALANFWNTEMLRRRLTALRQRGVRRLFLGSSLDGVGDTHDLIRGQKGAFDGLTRSIQMLRAEFPELGFSFSFTITPKNYRELWKTYSFVTDLGAGFGAQAVVNHQGYEAPETYRWRPEELKEVARQIDHILADIVIREKALERIVRGEEKDSRWLWSKLLFWRYLREYVLRPRRFFKNCLAGERFAMFDPEGNLFYCPVNKHRRIGNVREQSMGELWRSPKAEEERRYVSSCQCDCWLNCIANPILEQLVAGALPASSAASR